MIVDGSPLYLGSTDDCVQAKTTMWNAARVTALDYFVYDFELGLNVATSFEGGGFAGNADESRAP